MLGGAGKLRSADCVAEGRVQVVVINKKDFLDLDNPLLAWMLDSDAVTTVLRVPLCNPPAPPHPFPFPTLAFLCPLLCPVSLVCAPSSAQAFVQLFTHPFRCAYITFSCLSFMRHAYATLRAGGPSHVCTASLSYLFKTLFTTGLPGLSFGVSSVMHK